MVVDPARQFTSPYVGMGNNPIGYYDEDGQWVWLIPMVVGGFYNYITSENHTWKDFAIGVASGLFAYASSGGTAAFSWGVSEAAQVGLSKFGTNLMANMVWRGIDEATDNKTGIIGDIFGPLVLETGLNQLANANLKGWSKEDVDDVAKQGKSNLIKLNEEELGYTAAKGGTSLENPDIVKNNFTRAYSNGDFSVAYSAATQEKLPFNRTWLMPHTAATPVNKVIQQGTMTATTATFSIGGQKFGYGLFYVCHQSAANSISQWAGTAYKLASQTYTAYGILGPSLTSALYGTGRMYVPFVGLWSNYGYNRRY